MRPSLTPNRPLNSAESPRARSETQRESDRLKLLLDITNTLVSNLESRDLIRAISTSIRQVMHCDVVGVWLPDADQRQLRQRVMDFPESKGFAREDLVQPVEGSLVGSAFKTGKAAIRTSADFTNYQATTDVARGEGIVSSLALPLIIRNRTLGAVGLGSRTENAFSHEDVDFLMRVAGQVAIAVENALAYREIADLKDKRAQEKLYLEEEIRSTSDFEGIIGNTAN